MTHASLSRALAPRAGALAPIAAWPGALRRRLAREAEFGRAARRLARLDDRLLADMGLTRDQIEHAVRHGRAPRR